MILDFYEAIVVSDPHVAFPVPGLPEVNIIVEVIGEGDSTGIQAAVIDAWVPARGEKVGVVKYDSFYLGHPGRGPNFPRLVCPIPERYKQMLAEHPRGDSHEA